MRTKDTILLEQAYVKVVEANTLSVNRQKVNRDPEVLARMFQYLSTRAEFFGSVHGLVFGEEDWSREKSISKDLKNGSLQDLLMDAPQVVEDLNKQGYDWTRIFLSTHRVLDPEHPNGGRVAQLMDITNTVTLIHNSNHILMRAYDPFGIMPSKELRVETKMDRGVTIPSALLKAESLLASLYGVQQ
jgi:hypothetical protein